jgi:hypothetical protein
MKKEQIMLTAVIIIAIIGVPLAFKAKYISSVCYYSSTTSHDGYNGDYCTYNSGTCSIVDNPVGDKTYATTIDKMPGQPCPTDIAVSCPELVNTICGD